MSDEKPSLQQILDKMPNNISLPWHDIQAKNDPEAYIKEMQKTWGEAFNKASFSPILISWSVEGVGFGEYAFWQEDGKIYCDNECMSRESVKKVLCMMVDQAVFPEERPEKV